MSDLDCHYSGLPSVKSYDMKQQTAIEWFYDQITRTSWDYKTVEQALVMEKKQIMVAYDEGVMDSEVEMEHDIVTHSNSEQYYNKKYNDKSI
jgi:hypothetical protein